MYTLILGLRSLLFRKRQYTSLLLVCLVGVGISLFSIFLIRGMLFSLEAKARIYYGGDYQFIGGVNSLDFADASPFIEKLRPVFGEEAVIAPRFDFDADNAAFFFEGASARQRVIKGVDFETESALFKEFNYIGGSSDDMAHSNGILLSEPIAERLGIVAGDEMTLMIRTVQGYINTVPLIVKGVFRDSSLFGMYTSYMDIDCLRNAFGVSATYANRIAVDLGKTKGEGLEKYHEKLSSIFKMYRIVDDKKIFYNDLLGGKFSEPTYAVIDLSANMDELRVLISAMEGISAAIIITLIVIIIAGIGSTYRVLIMKRINEIGIYMAIGMKKSAIMLSILSESLFLLLAGCVSGLLFSLLLCLIAHLVNFSFIPAFDIFLMNSHLVPIFDAKATALISLSVIILTLIAVVASTQKIVRVMPVKALSTTE